MARWLTYDLETTFLQKGYRRADTLLLEVALYGKKVADKARLQGFSTLVNPIGAVADGCDLIAALKERGQNPNSTVQFWAKLLVEKKFIDSSFRRSSIVRKADEIARVLNASDDFQTPECALQTALKFGDGHTLVAHNGTSFDEKIVRGNCDRLGIPVTIPAFVDSLRLFRHKLPDQPSYSQPILYRSMLKGRYLAHHALEDAKALHKMLLTLEKQTDESVLDMFASLPSTQRNKAKKKYESDLYEISGVGVKSVGVFFDNKIRSKQDLKRYVDQRTITDWNKRFGKVHAYKSLGKKLFDGEIDLC